MPTSEELVYAENPNFGGPASVKVVSDSGVSGIRGTDFFLSSGDPNIYGTMTYTRPESLNDHIQRFYYSSSVFNGAVSPGEIKFDNLLLPTKLYISIKNTSGINISNIIKGSFLSVETIKGSVTLNRQIPFQSTVNPIQVLALKILSFPTLTEEYVEFTVEVSTELPLSLPAISFDPTNGEELIVTFLDTPNLFDVCTNIAPFSDGYLDLYTYRNPIFDGEVGTKWYRELPLTPAGFPLNLPITFNSSGKASTKDDPQYDIKDQPVPEGLLPLFPLLTYQNISIQFNIIGDNPIAANVSIDPDPTKGFIKNIQNGTFELVLDFDASEYVNGAWVPLTGPKLIHMIITVDITP